MTTPVAPPVEPTTQPAAPAPPAPTPPAAPAAAPPWGSDAEFNPEKAWNLIEGLRADKEKLASRQLTPEQQKQLDDYNAQIEAQKTEAQRLQDTATAAQRDAEAARAEATRYKVAATHGISADNFDLLGEGTEAEITARAEKLVALAAQAAAAATPQAVPPVPGQRPVEQLRPGATPTGTKTDDDLNYEKLFGPEAK